MAEPTPMQMCPMAETCKGMMEKPSSGLVLIVPGIVLMLLAVAVLIEPRILPWLVAFALLIMGAAMVALASLMRRIGSRVQNMHG